MCYKDKTYCVADCATKYCDTKLTDEIRKAADAEGLSIMRSDMVGACPYYESHNLEPCPSCGGHLYALKIIGDGKAAFEVACVSVECPFISEYYESMEEVLIAREKV